MENILESFNSVSEYNIDASTFEAQIYLLLSDDREKDTTSMNEKRDAIPSDWDTGLAPTDWGLSPPPPPGSWGNTVYHSVYSTQNTNALPIPTISASSSTYNTSPTIDSSTLVIYKSRIRHRTRHKTKQQNQTSTIGSAPTAASLNTDGSNPEASNHRIGPIVGGVVGGVCGAALLAILLCVLLKRSKKKKLQNNGSISSLDMYSYRPDYNNTPCTLVQPAANTHYDFDYIYYSPDVGKDGRYVSPTEKHSHRSWGDSSTASNTAVYLPSEMGHHSELISPYDPVKPNAK